MVVCYWVCGRCVGACEVVGVGVVWNICMDRFVTIGAFWGLFVIRFYFVGIEVICLICPIHLVFVCG